MGRLLSRAVGHTLTIGQALPGCSATSTARECRPPWQPPSRTEAACGLLCCRSCLASRTRHASRGRAPVQGFGASIPAMLCHIAGASITTSSLPTAPTSIAHSEALHDMCWLHGLGWYLIGASGQMLERSIVDSSVRFGERLCFEGAPEVVPPLAQDAAARAHRLRTRAARSTPRSLSRS